MMRIGYDMPVVLIIRGIYRPRPVGEGRGEGLRRQLPLRLLLRHREPHPPNHTKK